MKVSNILIVIFIIGLFSVPAKVEGTDWALVLKDEKGNDYYVDSTSMKRSSKNVINYWEKLVISNPDGGMAEVKVYKENDCRENEDSPPQRQRGI